MASFGALYILLSSIRFCETNYAIKGETMELFKKLAYILEKFRSSISVYCVIFDEIGGFNLYLIVRRTYNGKQLTNVITIVFQTNGHVKMNAKSKIVITVKRI